VSNKTNGRSGAEFGGDEANVVAAGGTGKGGGVRDEGFDLGGERDGGVAGEGSGHPSVAEFLVGGGGGFGYPIGEEPHAVTGQSGFRGAAFS
jgi:hypothetical protein